MPVHYANRINSARAESVPDALQNLTDERPSIKPEAGKSSPRELGSRDKGMRRQLSSADLPGKTKVAAQNKVTPKENKDEGSSQQRGNNSGNGQAPATPSRLRAGGTRPASRPTYQPATSEPRGYPILNLFGKFGQVILHGLEIMNKLLEQLTSMFMATMGRASRSADQANRM